MNKVQKIENCTYKSIVKDIDKYVELFLSHGVVAFHNVCLSSEQQGEIMNLFGQRLNWGHVSQINTEDHSLSIEIFKKNNEIVQSTADQILIAWHLEHVMSSNPQIAASWNMLKLTCKKGSGLTGFVHARDLYNLMPEEWIDFLNRSTIVDDKKNFPQRKAIQVHPNTKEPIIRVNPNTTDLLLYVDSQEPTQDSIDLFNTIKNWIFNNVNHNTSIQKWWEWSVYDMIVVDLFSMNHAVKGGFKIGERIFSRFWAFQEDPSGHKYKSFI